MIPIFLAGLFKGIADICLWGDNRYWFWNWKWYQSFRTRNHGLENPHALWVIPFDAWHLGDNGRTYFLLVAGLWIGEYFGADYPVSKFILALVPWAIQGTVFLAFFHVIFKRRPIEGLKEWYGKYFGGKK